MISSTRSTTISSDTTAEGLYCTISNPTGRRKANLRTSQSKVRRESSPVISHAVILFKDNYRQNINLDRLSLTFNGLGFTAAQQICFYSHLQHFGNLDLNFSFIEDNSKMEIVRKSDNPKADVLKP